MRPNQPRWYVVKEERARQFAALKFSIKQKANGKFMVLCRPQDLWNLAPEAPGRKGMVSSFSPSDVTHCCAGIGYGNSPDLKAGPAVIVPRVTK